MTMEERQRVWLRRGMVAAAVLLLALMASFNQVKLHGLKWQEAEWEKIYEISTQSYYWQPLYSRAAVETIQTLGNAFNEIGLPRPQGLALIVAQLSLIILLMVSALGYWRSLGVSTYTALLGLSAVAWGITQAKYHQVLPIWPLCHAILLIWAAWATVRERLGILLLLAVLCVFSAEIIAPFIPLFILAVAWKKGKARGVSVGLVLTLLSFPLIYVILNFASGDFLVQPMGHAAGVWGIVPLLTLVAWRLCPPVLHTLAWMLAPLWLCLLLLLAEMNAPHAFLVPLILIFLPVVFLAMENAEPKTWSLPKNAALVLLCAALMSAFTVWYQISIMDSQGGLAWYERVQWERTCQVMAGEQGTPWQYRLFTDSIVYGTVRAFETFQVPRPIGTAFLLIRLCQNMLIFVLAVWFYRKLGIPLIAALFGTWLLASGMCHGLYDTDMTFNTYTDVSIFLAAGLLLVYGKDKWLIPLMVIAPFNRETSGAIPIMYLFSRWKRGRPWTTQRVAGAYFIVLLGLWLLIVGSMRLPFIFGMRPYIVPTAGKEPIWPLLWYNLTWYRTWIFLFATLGLMPLMALLSWRAWPQSLRRFFWAVAPVWFSAHFCLAHAPETRLFLVPQVLLFIPGALLGIAYWNREGRAPACPESPCKASQTKAD
jgi:hypothetical protein